MTSFRAQGCDFRRRSKHVALSQFLTKGSHFSSHFWRRGCIFNMSIGHPSCLVKNATPSPERPSKMQPLRQKCRRCVLLLPPSPLLFLMKGLHFRQTLVPISNEGVAFAVQFQAKGLHFRPRVRGSGAFLPKGSHFLPQTASHVSPCRIGQESVRKRRFSIENRYNSGKPNI